MILLVILLLVLLQTINCCDCRARSFYNRTSNTCENDPIKGSKYYQEGCKKYLYNGDHAYYFGYNDDPIVCTQCLPSYREQNQKCYKTNLEGCIQFRNYKQCSKCDETQYYLSGYNCFKVPKDSSSFQYGCAKFYQYSDICEGCIDGYYFNSTNYICYKNPTQQDQLSIKNCQKYYVQNNVMYCLDCEQGFIPTQNKTCERPQQLIQNCTNILEEYTKQPEKYLEYGFPSRCVICKEGYHPYSDGSGCVENPSPSSYNYVKNCKIYQYQSTGKQWYPKFELVCDSCDVNYSLQHNQCVYEQNPIYNCKNMQIYYKNTLGCFKCFEGYTPYYKKERFAQECKKCPNQYFQDDAKSFLK